MHFGRILWIFAKVVMDLVSLTHHCSHALVTTSKKVKGNYQDFDHDDHHDHLDRLDAWRLLNKLSIAALWHQKFPLAAAAAAHNVLPSQTFVIFHRKYYYYHHYHQCHQYHHYHQFHRIINSIIITIVIIAIIIIFIVPICTA